MPHLNPLGREPSDILWGNTMPAFNDAATNAQISELRKRGEEKLMQALAPQYGLQYIDLRGYTINPEAVTLIKELDARGNNILAFELNRKLISIATNKPHAPVADRILTNLRTQGFTIQLFLCSEASLEHGFARYADQKNSTASKKGVLDINPDDILKSVKNIQKVTDVANALTNISTINSPRRISETLELIFAGALALKASDIHIEPEVAGVRLRYRLDGVLLDIFDLDVLLCGRIISRLKLLSGMTLNQRKEAQDGRFQFVIGDREIEVRSSIIPGASGESLSHLRPRLRVHVESLPSARVCAGRTRPRRLHELLQRQSGARGRRAPGLGRTNLGDPLPLQSQTTRPSPDPPRRIAAAHKCRTAGSWSLEYHKFVRNRAYIGLPHLWNSRMETGNPAIPAR